MGAAEDTAGAVASALTDVEVRLDMLGQKRCSGAANNAGSGRYAVECGGERMYVMGSNDRKTELDLICVFDL